MLRYTFIILPLLVASFVWTCSILDFNTDFIVPSVLIFIGTVGWLEFKQNSKLQKLIVLYITITTINEFTAYYSALHFGSNNPVFHFYVLAQFVLLGMIYSDILISKKYRPIFWIMISIILLACLFNSFYFSSIRIFPSFNIILLAAFILTLSLFQFRKMILYPIDQKLENQPVFWFNFGSFIFYSFGFFLLGFLSSTENLPIWMFDILWGANLFLLSTYFIAIYLDTKLKPTKT